MHKEFNKYQTKGAFQVKDVDTKTRRVTIMLSKFDNVDSDGDVIRKGAFAKSIQERGPESTSNRKIAFLRYHDWEHQIGKFISLEETHDGLVAIGELGRSSKANDALLDYQDGIIKEHSIGFNYIQDKMDLVTRDGAEFWDIKEVALWEGSAVTFGANSLTPTLDVSKGNRSEHIEKVLKRMSELTTAIKSGGTDERLYEIEMALKVCHSQITDLMKATEPAASTQPDEQKDTNAKDFLLKLLK